MREAQPRRLLAHHPPAAMIADDSAQWSGPPGGIGGNLGSPASMTYFMPFCHIHPFASTAARNESCRAILHHRHCAAFIGSPYLTGVSQAVPPSPRWPDRHSRRRAPSGGLVALRDRRRGDGSVRLWAAGSLPFPWQRFLISPARLCGSGGISPLAILGLFTFPQIRLWITWSRRQESGSPAILVSARKPE